MCWQPGSCTAENVGGEPAGPRRAGNKKGPRSFAEPTGLGNEE